MIFIPPTKKLPLFNNFGKVKQSFLNDLLSLSLLQSDTISLLPTSFLKIFTFFTYNFK